MSPEKCQKLFFSVLTLRNGFFGSQLSLTLSLSFKSLKGASGVTGVWPREGLRREVAEPSCSDSGHVLRGDKRHVRPREAT